jgi:ATP-dependent Lon protease
MRITGFTQMEPFRIAKVEPMETTDQEGGKILPLLSEAVGSIPTCQPGAELAMKEITKRLMRAMDPESICDLLTYHFVRCGEKLSTALQSPSLVRRYELLVAEFRTIKEECAK